MAELGDEALAEHDAVGRLAVRLNVGKLVAVGGREASWLHLGAYNEGSWGEESVHVADAQAAVDLSAQRAAPGGCRAREGVPVGRAGERGAGAPGDRCRG